MNKARRDRIEAVRHQIGILMADVEALQEEEQEAFDSVPESLQQSERGQAAEAAAEALDDALTLLEDCDSKLGEAAE